MGLLPVPGRRAVGGFVLRPDYLATALLAQMGYFFPWIWLPLCCFWSTACRNWRRLESENERLGALPGHRARSGVFTAVACFRPVLPHWGLIGLVSIFPCWESCGHRGPSSTSRVHATAGCPPARVFTLVVLASRCSSIAPAVLQRGRKRRAGDSSTRGPIPTGRSLRLGQGRGQARGLGVLDDPNSFLFTRIWYQSAQIAHAIRLKRPVLCYNIDDPRGFAFWSNPHEWVGRDGILLVIDDEFVAGALLSPLVRRRDSARRLLGRARRPAVPPTSGRFASFINWPRSPTRSRPSGWPLERRSGPGGTR